MGYLCNHIWDYTISLIWQIPSYLLSVINLWGSVVYLTSWKRSSGHNTWGPHIEVSCMWFDQFARTKEYWLYGSTRLQQSDNSSSSRIRALVVMTEVMFRCNMIENSSVLDKLKNSKENFLTCGWCREYDLIRSHYHIFVPYIDTNRQKCVFDFSVYAIKVKYFFMINVHYS